MSPLTVSALFLLGVSYAYGYSAGAPESVCEDMLPKHPVDAQKTKMPYKISVSKNQVKGGDAVDITIGGKTFKGFFLQVRDDKGKPVGEFQIPANDKYAKSVNCHNSKTTYPQPVMMIREFYCSLWQRFVGGQCSLHESHKDGADNAATHKNATDKKDFKLTWKAPGSPGKYTVYATVAEDGGTFWVKKPTEVISVS
ncbi:unnamed protein product [Callosobruchus maculatus]|uniref:Reelin domain-containing protein n=1 Tax=Callosobruchus maculatus TaxID=64391 RepID=A0A653BU25_CALMS|nr:unnamed protein product [Callosobruchus maculatus]